MTKVKPGVGSGWEWTYWEVAVKPDYNPSLIRSEHKRQVVSQGVPRGEKMANTKGPDRENEVFEKRGKRGKDTEP